MEFRPQDINKLKNLIDDSHKILLLAHRRPDPDAIGSNLAMRIALERLGKKVTSTCIDSINLEHYFMPNVYLFIKDFGKPEDYDLIMTLDCGDSNMTGFNKQFPDIWDCGVPIVNIDHHKTNDDFGSVNIVKADSASTNHMLYFLFNELKWKINIPMANLMMAGLSYDTGQFQHDNTTPEVLFVAGKLIEKGARIDFISKNLYHTVPVPVLKVWGKALSRLKMNNHKVVSTIITEDDVKSVKANIDELKGADLITYMNGVPGNKFALLMSEKNGLVKGSLRTQNEDVDVAKIAQKYFNGGGHKKAAGFALPGKLYIDSFERRKIINNEQ